MKKSLFSILIISMFSILVSSCEVINNNSNNTSSLLESADNVSNNNDSIEITVPIIEGTKGLKYEKMANKNEYQLVGIGTASDTNIVVASVYEGLPVTTIAENAFIGDEANQSLFENKITSLVIPEGIKTLQTRSFINLPSLETVQLPNSLENVGDYVFNGCYSMVAYNIKNLQYIGSVSNPCMMLLKANEPKSITTVEIDSRCKFINAYAFNTCLNVKSIVIPEGVKTIGSSAFRFCSVLETIEFPESLTFIGDNLFSSCSSLKKLIEGNYTYVGSSNNPYLILIAAGESDSSININSRCKFIYSEAFSQDSYIVNAEFPSDSQLLYIGNNAFFYCSLLESIKIPAGVKYIGINAFRACSKLSTIIFEGTRKQWEEIKKDINWNEKTNVTSVSCKDGVVNI